MFRDQARKSRSRLGIAVEGVMQKLEYIGIVQKVSGIHIVPDDILRSCHPVAAVKAGPCTVIPVIGPLSTDSRRKCSRMKPDSGPEGLHFQLPCSSPALFFWP